jgi:hypothetical protein
VWGKIIGCFLNIPPSAVDAATVQHLELLAPATSESDQICIEKLMRSRTIFPAISDPRQRERLFLNIKAIDCMIPSLKTFYDNLIFLEPCCKILRQLLDPEMKKKTIRRGFRAVYLPPETLEIEFQEGVKRPYQSTTPNGDWFLRYIALWAFCVRYFAELVPVTPRMEVGKDKPPVKEPNPFLWRELARLAVNSGFPTGAALELEKRPIDRYSIHFFLCVYAQAKSENRCIEESLARNYFRNQREQPQFTDENSLEIKRRSGIPFNDDYYKDQLSFFIPTVIAKVPEPGWEITPFFVKYDFFRAFLTDSKQQVLDLALHVCLY